MARTAEMNNPKLYTIEDELNIDGGNHVLAMFLNLELFWTNNNSAFVSYEELWPRRITPSSISIVLHKILSLIL